jgi:cytochrome c oxidase subunit 2
MGGAALGLAIRGGQRWILEGATMRFAKLLTAMLGAVLALAGATVAMAANGHSENWQIGMQEAVTPNADGIHFFHNDILLPIITLIALFVLALLVYVMVKFNAKANPVPSKTTHNTTVEVLWTVIPILILVGIAIPSFRLLYLERDIPAGDMTLKVTGQPSWNWTYDYPDLGTNDDGSAKVSFSAYLKSKEDAEKDGVPYLLSTDVPVVVPVGKVVKLIVTSDPEGIIHSWTVPSFGLKIDAIPGRLNEDWFQAEKEGVFYGQCSELCGKDHAFMPIEVWVVSVDNFNMWSDAMKSGADDAKMKDILKQIHPAPEQVAQN